jgi:heme O synthase-like polyprenyltransferase
MGALYFILPAGLYFLYRAIRLTGSLDMADARQLFFASLAYNPLVFTGLLIF